MQTRIAIICTGIFLGMTSGCVISIPASHRYETDPIESSVDFEGCREFEAKLTNGTIDIEGWDQPTAAMVARVWSRAYSAESAKRLAESTKIELKRVEGKVAVVYTPALPLLQNEQIGVSVMVHLPFKAAVTAETSFGDVSAAKLAGPIELNTSHGDINLKSSRGPVKCHTSYGDVILEDSMGQVNCQTSHGDIILKNTRGPVDCRTSYGDINVTDAADAIHCSTSHGDIKVSVAASGWKGQKIKLKTSYGNVKINMLTE